MLNAARLKTAGWLTIFQMVLVIPTMVVSAIEVFTDNPAVNALEVLLGAATTAMGIYIVLVFKELLNKKASFHGVDVLIWISIGLSLLSFLFQLVYLIEPDVVLIVALVTIIPSGVVSLVLGIKLLSCPDKLFGYLKPLAILYIVFGAMALTVLLAIPAILVSFPIYIFHALVFFRASDEVAKGNEGIEGTV